MTHNTCNMLVLQYIYTVCMCISMCDATMHTCVVFLFGQYSILTSIKNIHTYIYIYIIYNNYSYKE